MKTKTNTKPINITAQTKSDALILFKAAAVAVISFLISGTRLFGVMSPFGIALLAGLPMGYAITGLAGAITGTLVFSAYAPMPADMSIYYILIFISVFAVKLCFAKLLHVKPKPFMLCIISTSIMLMSALIYYNLSSSVLLNLPIMLLEGILAGSFTYFYALCSDALLKKRTSGLFSYIELSSMVIAFVSVIAAVCEIEIININLGVIIGVLSIYIVMTRFGIVGASVSSIVIAIAFNLHSFNMLEFSGMLIISSFLAGVFSPLKKFAQMSAFIAVNTYCMFLLGAPISLSYRLIEIFFATAIFVVLPDRLFTFISSKHIENNGEGPASSLFQTSIKTKLNFASDTIKDLQNDLIAVSKKFADIDTNNISSVYENASSRACKGCSMQLGCWDNNYSSTMDAFQPIGKILKEQGELQISQLPKYFQDNCCKTDKLTTEINNCYQAFMLKLGNRRHVAESRQLVVEQFNSIADMLLEVSEELGEINGYDAEMSKRVMRAYTKIENEPSQVICAIDRYGRTCIEIYSDFSIRTSARNICQTICEVTDKDFDLPSISKVSAAGKTKIALFEKATYTLDFSVQQKACSNNRVCGDSYEFFLNSKGYAYMILSDGMGNGKRAAIDSVMTCSILLKLIKAGFGLESAIKLINSSLLVKSSDESIATIDIARIDLYTGKVEFLKAGAAASYMYSKSNTVKIDTGSLPVGILQGIEFDKKASTIREGDIVVLVSDGATDSGEEWIADEIRSSSHATAREISAKLLHMAKHKQGEGFDDDITIMVAKLNKGV